MISLQGHSSGSTTDKRLTEGVSLAVKSSNLVKKKKKVFLKSIFTSEVNGPVLPGRQHHCQGRLLHVGQSSQLWICHGCSLRIREHADLPVVQHHLQDNVQSGSNETEEARSQSETVVVMVALQQIYRAVS